MYKHQIKVLCSECRERFSEQDVALTNIEEDICGYDVVTFVCPKCNKSVKSKRFG